MPYRAMLRAPAEGVEGDTFTLSADELSTFALRFQGADAATQLRNVNTFVGLLRSGNQEFFYNSAPGLFEATSGPGNLLPEIMSQSDTLVVSWDATMFEGDGETLIEAMAEVADFLTEVLGALA